MKTVCCLLISALAAGQPTSRSEWQLAPQLARGVELTYSGTFTEETLIPNVQFQRKYRLETLVFVLDSGARHWNVAFMTALSPGGPRTENADAKPISVRLEIGQVDLSGRVSGARPGQFLPPLSGPPLLEAGCLVEGPPSRVAKNSLWEVNDGDRPPLAWQVVGLEATNGVTCVKIVGQQQSSDWDKPRADHTAWRRRDVVWVHPQMGIAQRVERTIERSVPSSS